MTTIVQKKVFAALPRTQRGKAVRITGDPEGENFLYCNGNNVFIRNLQDPTICDIYTQHSKQTTVARYSPTRFYIASGDIGGKIRIWDTVNPEHILKAEYPVLAGEICDLSWSPDSKKIAVGGHGQEKYGHVINMDTGTSVGEISGNTKTLNTISYRAKRPFRVIGASEDMFLRFYEGPPFKFKKSLHLNNFANVARFSGDGNALVSGGADGKLIRHDSEHFEEAQTMEFCPPKAHNGGIYEICFSPDNTEILTASGDKTAKIFNVESGEEVCKFDMGKSENKWQNMQQGCLWQGNELLTVNAMGHIIYHDRNNPDLPKRVIKGHMKPITSLVVTDRSTVFTAGDHNEGIIYWDVDSGDNDSVSGKGHSANVLDMVVSGDYILSVGVDDTLRVVSLSSKDFTDIEIKLDSQPVKIDSKIGKTVVACREHLIVVEEEGDRRLKKAPVLRVTPEPSCVSVHPNGCTVAVGFKANEVRIYSLQNGELIEQKKKQIQGDVSCLAYSPDGEYLAYGASTKVGVLSTRDYELSGEENSSHTARVLCLGWSPDSLRFATGSLDNSMKVFPTKITYGQKPTIKAYTMSFITSLAWLDPFTVITASQDSNVKQFSVSDDQQQQQQQAKC